MHEEKRVGMKKRQTWIFVVILTMILGGASGFLYIDTFYGKGYAKGFFSEQKKTKENKMKQQGATKEEIVKEEIKEEILPTEVTDNRKLKHGMEIESKNKTSFQMYGEHFLMCTKDGVRFFNDFADPKWNDTFTMNSPMSVKEGDFTAVGDMTGSGIRVYDATGPKYKVQTEGTLIQFALNENGYLATICKNKSSYKIMIYNNLGEELKGRVEETIGIYPLSVDISDDNKVFVVSYLDTTDIEPIARVLFFYINRAEGENFTDSMFAAVEKPDEIIPIITYMKNGILAVISDKNIYGLKGEGQSVWKLELTNQLDRVDVTEKEYIVAAYGDEFSGKDGKEAGTVVWIDSSGKEHTIFEMKDRVSYLNASEGSVVIGAGYRYYNVKSNGKVIWEHRAIGDMSDILLMGSDSTVLYVTKTRAEMVDINSLNRKVKGLNATLEREILEKAKDKNVNEEVEFGQKK